MKPDPDAERPSSAANEWFDDEALERAHAEQKRKRRRALGWLCGGVMAVFGGFATVIVYSDAPEPDVSDLMPRPLVLRDDENLYAQLVAKGAALLAKPLIAEDAVDETAPRPAPPAGEGGAVAADGASTAVAGGGGLFGGAADSEEWQAPNLRERLARGEGWTAERLALYGPPLDAVAADARELLARYPQAQGTVPTSSASALPPSNEIRAFGSHVNLAAWAAYRSGDQSEALSRAMLGLRLGRAIRESRGSLIDYFTGIGIEGQTLEITAQWTNSPETQATTLRELADGLDVLGAGGGEPAGYVDVLKVEFGWGWGTLRNDVTAELTAKGGMWMGAGVELIGRTRVLFPLIYKRNLTAALYAESIREEIAWTRMTVAEEKIRRARPSFCAHCEALAGDAWLRPANLLGRYIITMVMPTFSRGRQTAATADSRRSLLRAAVALRLYSLDHDGALPASLAELVPAYLPAAPRDFADGGEIRYSREARALWSVGVNDLRITMSDQEIKDVAREAVFWLKFVEPAQEAEAASTETAEPINAGVAQSE